MIVNGSEKYFRAPFSNEAEIEKVASNKAHRPSNLELRVSVMSAFIWFANWISS